VVRWKKFSSDTHTLLPNSFNCPKTNIFFIQKGFLALSKPFDYEELNFIPNQCWGRGCQNGLYEAKKSAGNK